jgi:predicted AAA+ superfamily ATPase
MIQRSQLRSAVLNGLRLRPVVALMGPRQCGKTTLAREIAKLEGATYFDLEDPTDQVKLANPKLVLEPLRGLVILDEIQKNPKLTELLRVLADRVPLPCRFLVLGSASPDVVRQASDSLAGRVHFVDMSGFSLEEVGESVEAQKKLWCRGGFPASFLSQSDAESWKWREDFVRTFLERDMPQLGVRIASETLRRFWTMIAHYHGQVWNGSEVGASLGVSHHTSRHYLDLLSGTFVLRILPPWFENLGKRVVKSPKVYVRDSGLLHLLLNLPDAPSLFAHPKLGASWEGFCIEQILAITGERNAYFWSTQSRSELDLLVMARGKRWGFEFKCADAPTMTKSLHSVMADLCPERVWIVHPGNDTYPIHEKAEVVPLASALAHAKALMSQ